MPQDIMQIALDPEGTLYALTNDNEIYWLGKNNMKWHKMPNIDKDTIYQGGSNEILTTCPTT